jgi:hypothetical protein
VMLQPPQCTCPYTGTCRQASKQGLCSSDVSVLRHGKGSAQLPRSRSALSRPNCNCNGWQLRGEHRGGGLLPPGTQTHLRDCLAQRALHALRAPRVRQQHAAAVAHNLRLLRVVPCVATAAAARVKCCVLVTCVCGMQPGPGLARLRASRRVQPPSPYAPGAGGTCVRWLQRAQRTWVAPCCAARRTVNGSESSERQVLMHACH